MLRSLHLKDVGPAARFDLELGERLNVLTGDNGLGKSFILEVAWWALTGTWVGRPVLPKRGLEDTAEMQAGVLLSDRDEQAFTSHFVRGAQGWEDPYRQQHAYVLAARDLIVPVWVEGADPVLYVRADGSLSLWDPQRNHQPEPGESTRKMPRAYDFKGRDLWDGLDVGGRSLCNGLIQDWVMWQLRAGNGGSQPFRLLERVLQALSHPGEKMIPGEPVRLYLDDLRDFPTVELPYETVPVIHASAGMRRVIGLAYFIAWAWTEHLRAAALLGGKPAERIVVLIEEPETHLHPTWQRHILPALIDVLTELSPAMKPQILATTHSPLVLASLEPHFEPNKDKLFSFELELGQVILRDVPWVKHGDAIGWLTSDIFGLEQARSVEAERAIEAAYAFSRGDFAELPIDLPDRDAIHRELVRVLPDQDPF